MIKALPFTTAFSMALTRGMLLIAMAFLTTLLQAQVQSAPTIGAFQFSDGVHPCFDAVYQDADGGAVERFWRDELKAISIKVSGSKELIAHAARIPAATTDTLRIFLRIERPKGSTYTIAHVAFLTTRGFVGPDSPKREVAACTDFVQHRTVILMRRFAQEEFDQGQRKLKQLMRDMDLLKREKVRSEQTIASAQERAQDALADKAEATSELERSKASPQNDDLDSTARAQEQKDRIKDEKRLQGRADKASHTSERSTQKVKVQQRAIKQNETDQVAKQAEIDRQQRIVQELEEKLKAIH